ncbi:MAG TPA: hypothetical protein VH327_07010 [Gammaproteobacteria bacterium]|jgi:hypothetical protein|nr:hypothetical protein [Gammaproteobacteria bacterium]
MKLRIVVGLLAGLLLGVAVAADKPADVRDLMTATQFHATGLDTLNPEQLAAFNAWLAAYAHSAAAGSGAASASVAVPAVVAPAAPAMPVVAAPAPTPAVPTPAPAATSNTNAFGQQMLAPAKRDEPARIESTLVGHFTGWNGSTVFKLANGQVWKQAGSGYFQANLQDPKVVIKRLAFGYLLTLPGQGDTVFVKRVQ